MSFISPVDKYLAVVYSRQMPIPFREELVRRGYKFCEVYEYPAEDITHKGGGGSTCLTRALERVVKPLGIIRFGMRRTR